MAGVVVVPLAEALFQAVGSAIGVSLPIANQLFPKDAVIINLDKALNDFFVNTFAAGGQLWQASMRPIVDQVVSQLKAVMPTIQNLSNEITAILGHWLSSSPAISNAIIDGIQRNLGPALAQASITLEAAFNQTNDILVDSLKNFWSPTLELVTNTYNLLTRAVNEFLSPIATTMNIMLTNFGAVILSQMPQIIDAFKVAVNAGIAGLDVFVQQTYSAVTNVVGSALTQLGELEYYISTEFKFWVGEAAEYIINSLRGAQQGIGQIGDIVDGWGRRIEREVESIAAADQAYYTDLATRIDVGYHSFADSVVQQVQSSFGGMWDGFRTDVIGPAGAAASTFFGGIWDGIRGFFGEVGCEATAVANWFGGIFEQITKWIMSICGANCKNASKNPFDIITRSLTSVMGVGGSLGISLTLGELVHPLKNLGLSRLAAYVWDMADFKSVGGDVLKMLNSMSTLAPLKYGLNEFFRPSVIDTKTADEWLFRELITIADWRKVYAQHGFADTYIDAYQAAVWAEPSDRLLIAMMDAPGVPQEWIDTKIKAKGYDALDQQLFKVYMTMRRLSDEFGSLKGAYEAAFIKGYVDYEQYGAILRAIGKSEIEVAWALESANRKAETQRLNEDIDILINAFRTGKLDLAAFDRNIHGLPIIPERAANIIEKEIARRKATAAAERAQKQAKVSLGEIFKAYDLGLMDELQALGRIVILGYLEDDANLLMQVHKAEIAERETNAEEKAALAAAKAKATEEQRLAAGYASYLIKAMRARLISIDVVKSEIAALPLSDARKDLLIAQAELENAKETQDDTADKPKTLREPEIYKALNLGIITFEDAVNFLRVLGFDDELIEIKLAVNKPLPNPAAL